MPNSQGVNNSMVRMGLGIMVLLMWFPLTAQGTGPHMMKPRVPAEERPHARQLKNPLPRSADIIEQGKSLYEEKGGCVNCHGALGNGKGPGGQELHPPPRNFQHAGFWRHRTIGEIFWVIKHGSPGTAMIPFGGLLTDKEIWTIIRYEQTFSHGPVESHHNQRMRRHHNQHHQGGNTPCC